jgi:hypothetical protein
MAISLVRTVLRGCGLHRFLGSRLLGSRLLIDSYYICDSSNSVGKGLFVAMLPLCLCTEHLF